MSLSSHEEYGIRDLSLDEARARIEQALGLTLEQRDSSYYAGTYYRHRADPGRSLMLYNNRDTDRSSWVRPRYRAFPVLLDISNLEAMDQIRQRLQAALDLVLLRQTTIWDNDDFPDDDEDDDDKDDDKDDE